MRERKSRKKDADEQLIYLKVLDKVLQEADSELPLAAFGRKGSVHASTSDQGRQDVESLTKNQRRSRIKRAVRGHVVHVEQESKSKSLIYRELFTPEEGYDHDKPKTRGDCQGHEGTCPWISCKYHLYLDVFPSGSIKFNFPDIEPYELEHSCALDVAEKGGQSLEQVGAHLNVTRERIRQIENRAKERLAIAQSKLADHLEPEENLAAKARRQRSEQKDDGMLCEDEESSTIVSDDDEREDSAA